MTDPVRPSSALRGSFALHPPVMVRAGWGWGALSYPEPTLSPYPRLPLVSTAVPLIYYTHALPPIPTHLGMAFAALTLARALLALVWHGICRATVGTVVACRGGHRSCRDSTCRAVIWYTLWTHAIMADPALLGTEYSYLCIRQGYSGMPLAASDCG